MENKYSPIVEQQKFDGFVIDYYFLADCLSRFIEARVMENVNDEKFVKNVRRKIKSDFASEGDLFWKNAKFLISILEFLCLIVLSSGSKYLISQTAYSFVSISSGEEEYFLLNSVFLNNKKIERFQTNLVKIGSKSLYKMHCFGKRAISNLTLKLMKAEKKLRQF